MKVIAINGSPRKSWNTATLLEKALEGARSTGAETETINLYDIDYKGCRSCFTCKREHAESYGKCCINDGLKPVLEKIEQADVLFLGSPVYFRNISGAMMSFIERFLFPKMIYSNPMSSIDKGKLKVAAIFTMNVKEQIFNQLPLKQHLEGITGTLKVILGNVEVLNSFYTYQTDNYNDMEYSYFNIDEKKAYHETRFPLDCEKAFELGKQLAL